MTDVPQSPEEVLLEGFLALGTPDGFRAELLDGEIVVTPLPDGSHEHCVSHLVTQTVSLSETGMVFSGNKGLLIDRSQGSVTLFGDPRDGDYRDVLTHPFGKPVPLPAPFSFDLDTSEFG